MQSAAMVVRCLPLLLSSLLILLLASSCTAQVAEPKFQCRATTPKCQALAAYVTTNETTYDAIKSLFEVKSIRALYGANDVNASTPASTKVPAGATVRVPFPCACANGIGISDRRPVYTVVKDDTLYNIATKIFKGFVAFQQIAAVNNLPNASQIEIGQELRIPLPCSCDAVDGLETVHLAHLVAKDSTLAGIADRFGTTEETLLRINNISKPQDLQADQVLDVPLRACNSSIRTDALDYPLRVTNGSYALTARNCVKCSCSSSSWRLQCEKTSSSQCRAEACSVANSTGGQLSLGDSVPNGCATTRCEYAGYNNSTIFATAVPDQSACGTPPATGTPPSGAHALRPQPWGPSSWALPLLLLAPLHTALLLFAFL